MKNSAASELAELERPIAYFRGFWALIENGPNGEEVFGLDKILSSFSDFWTRIVQDEDIVDNQDLSDVEPESDDDDPVASYTAMDHFAQMFILESEQRYLCRTLQINDINMQTQKKRLKEVQDTVRILKLEYKGLVNARKRREAELRKERRKIEAGFVQFWKGIEEQEKAVGNDPDYAEYLGDFFPLTHQ